MNWECLCRRTHPIRKKQHELPARGLPRRACLFSPSHQDMGVSVRSAFRGFTPRVARASRVAAYAVMVLFGCMVIIGTTKPKALSADTVRAFQVVVGFVIAMALLSVHTLVIWIFFSTRVSARDSALVRQGGCARYFFAVFFFAIGLLGLFSGSLGGLNTGLFLSLFSYVLLSEAFSPTRESQELAAKQAREAEITRLAMQKRERDARRSSERRPYEEAVEKAGCSGPCTLSQQEITNAQQLVSQGVKDALLLATEAIRQFTPADIARVFVPEIIRKTVYSSEPGCLHVTAACLMSVEPCLRLLAFDVEQRLVDPDEEDFIWPGSPVCRKVVSRQLFYKELLENEFPPGFIRELIVPLSHRLERFVFNQNMAASWYEWVFTGDTLTALTIDGAAILAELPIIQPEKEDSIWTAYTDRFGGSGRELGSCLNLRQVKELSDSVADTLSRSPRDIFFGSLETFPDAPGHIRLAHSLARQESVILGRSTQCGPEVAKILACWISAP